MAYLEHCANQMVVSCRHLPASSEVGAFSHHQLQRQDHSMVEAFSTSQCEKSSTSSRKRRDVANLNSVAYQNAATNHPDCYAENRYGLLSKLGAWAGQQHQPS